MIAYTFLILSYHRRYGSRELIAFVIEITLGTITRFATWCLDYDYSKMCTCVVLYCHAIAAYLVFVCFSFCGYRYCSVIVVTFFRFVAQFAAITGLASSCNYFIFYAILCYVIYSATAMRWNKVNIYATTQCCTRRISRPSSISSA